MPSNIEIKKEKLLLVEGADAYFFLIWACQAFEINDVQVMNFEGNSDLTKFINTLRLLRNYELVKTIVIARDAEKDALAAIQSIQLSLKQAKLSIPNTPFQFDGNNPKIAYMLFPGFKDNSTALCDGTLEDLCWEIIKDKSNLDCVNTYIQCLEDNGFSIKRLHKTRLHSYLAGENDLVGLKIGEASKVGAWDWNHTKLTIFKSIIAAM